jgi:glycosyltransferase involved in cell wall biosynthesis
MDASFKRITIITPNYNQEEFLEQTIQSVLNQNYPNLEYIIIDGGSTDGSVDIIKKYEKYISYWISEPDNGMYDALNKGFAKSSGEIMGWINSDDILLCGALNSITKIFNDLEEVEWIQGCKGFINEAGDPIEVKKSNQFSYMSFLTGDYKWVQQESTFWKRSLWERSGSKINHNLKYAGDFELWFRFSKLAKLYNFNLPVGGWRQRKGQLSEVYMVEYEEEVRSVLKKNKLNRSDKLKLETALFLKNIEKFISVTKIFNIEIVSNLIRKLLDLNGLYITYSNDQSKFIIK